MLKAMILAYLFLLLAPVVTLSSCFASASLVTDRLQQNLSVASLFRQPPNSCTPTMEFSAQELLDFLEVDISVIKSSYLSIIANEKSTTAETCLFVGMWMERFTDLAVKELGLWNYLHQPNSDALTVQRELLQKQAYETIHFCGEASNAQIPVGDRAALTSQVHEILDTLTATHVLVKKICPTCLVCSTCSH